MLWTFPNSIISYLQLWNTLVAMFFSRLTGQIRNEKEWCVFLCCHHLVISQAYLWRTLWEISTSTHMTVAELKSECVLRKKLTNLCWLTVWNREHWRENSQKLLKGKHLTFKDRHFKLKYYENYFVLKENESCPV